MSALKFTIIETSCKELGSITIAVKEVPLYGEGNSRESAIEDLIDSTIEYMEVYTDQIESYSKYDSPNRKYFTQELIQCGANRNLIRKVYGL